MKTTSLRPPRLFTPVVEGNKAPTVEFLGGLWYRPSQTEMLAGHLHDKAGITLIVPPTTESPFIGGMSFDEFVKMKVERIERRGEETYLIDHSFGIHSAMAIATNTPLVKGVISLATGVHYGISVPFNKDIPLASIIKALLKRVSTVPKELESFILDGAETSLGSVSRQALWAAIAPRYFGYKTPLMDSLRNRARTASVIFRDDKLIPRELSLRLAREHAPEQLVILDGGHFAHTDPRYVHEVTEVVAGVIRSWVTVPNHN